MDRKTLTNEIYHTLRRQIIELEIKPGEALSEAETARKMDVSRQPVREAFIRLADDGFLLIRPQRPTKVVPISVHEVLKAQFLREAIEVATIQRAAQVWTSRQQDRLHDLINQQEEASAAGDFMLFHKLDEAFHIFIAEAANCRFAWDTVNQHKAHMDRVRFLSLDSGRPKAIAQHKQIAAALAANDIEQATAAMRCHLSEIKHFIVDIRSHFTDYFAADDQDKME